MGQGLKRARAAARATRKPPKAGPPQETVVHVVVKTDGPVPMKAVREVVAIYMRGFDYDRVTIAGRVVLSYHVKRDADVQRPQRRGRRA